ncbi:uncharacterized protein TNCV_1789891 [Trichonephila clavipes]|nr:uncharacterized protein TNCV_1789891 [Trichonephila clavipes]
MITNFFIPELNNHDVQELWFQQDGATCHTARATIDLLKDTFGDRLISRCGPVNWPPRSCDLTPLDYFLRGYVKSLVYADKPQTLDHLEDNIRRVIADIRSQMLEKVIESWTSRLDYIRASRGSPMPEIIFKMEKKESHVSPKKGENSLGDTRLKSGEKRNRGNNWRKRLSIPPEKKGKRFFFSIQEQRISFYNELSCEIRALRITTGCEIGNQRSFKVNRPNQKEHDTRMANFRDPGPPPPLPVPASPVSVKLYTYNGETNWEMYKIQFCIISEANGWPEGAKACQLAASFRDKAAEVLQTLPDTERLNLNSLYNALDLRFGQKYSKDYARLQMKTRLEKTEESSQEYAFEILKLITLAFSDFSANVREIISLDYFVDRLKGEEILRAVRMADAQDLKSVLLYALKFEAATQASCIGHQSARGDREIERGNSRFSSSTSEPEAT